MSRRRMHVAVAALLTLPASMLMLVSPPAALAASAISAPAADRVFTAGTSTLVEADLDPCAATTTLRVDNPQNSNSWTIVSPRPNGCDDVVGKPTDRRQPTVRPTWSSTMPNGRWKVTLSGGASATQYFYTSLPPATPSGLTAQGTGASRVDLSWSYSGGEQDLTGFLVADNVGNSFPVNDPSARSLTATYSNPEPGTYSYSYTVKAVRKSGVGSSTITGDKSGSASAELVTPQPPPSPTPTPTAKPTSTAGPSASPAPKPTAGGSTGGTVNTKPGATVAPRKPVLAIPSLNPVVAQRRTFALNFNTFSPSLGIPKLPPLPATTLASPEEGTFAPSLPYAAPAPGAGDATDVSTSPIAAVTALDGAQLAKSLAFALLLLAAAAHLRLFLSGHRAD